MIACLPAARDEIAKLACALGFSVPLPICVLPSRKRTVPVGVPAAELTVAVNVTDPPTAEGLADELSVVLVAVSAAVVAEEMNASIA